MASSSRHLVRASNSRDKDCDRGRWASITKKSSKLGDNRTDQLNAASLMQAFEICINTARLDAVEQRQGEASILFSEARAAHFIAAMANLLMASEG